MHPANCLKEKGKKKSLIPDNCQFVIAWSRDGAEAAGVNKTSLSTTAESAFNSDPGVSKSGFFFLCNSQIDFFLFWLVLI